jgi:hypothetical protein
MKCNLIILFSDIKEGIDYSKMFCDYLKLLKFKLFQIFYCRNFGCTKINIFKGGCLKIILLWITILILILIIIYQNDTKKEIAKVKTQNISTKKVEQCKEKLPESVEVIIDNFSKKIELSDQEALLKSKTNLKLSRVDENGVSIIWSIDAENFDKYISLIASLSKNDVEDKKVFKFNITKPSSQTKQNDIKNDIKSRLIDNFIKVDNESLDEVTSNLNLPEIGTDGSRIIWKSSNPNIVSSKGIVVRPSFNRDEVEVTLTAIISNSGGGEEVEKEFSITVMPDESEIREVK